MYPEQPMETTSDATDIANEIFQELGEPSTLLISNIIFWLSTNIGTLNLLIENCFQISSIDNSITPPMGDDEKAILKLLYERYYYTKLLNSVLSSASYGMSGAIQSVVEGNRIIKLVSQTEVAKSYQSMIVGISKGISTLIQAYKAHRNCPLEVIYENWQGIGNPFNVGYFGDLNVPL